MSMNTIQSNPTPTTGKKAGNPGVAIKLSLALVAVAALACNAYLVSKVSHLENKAETERAGLESQLRSLHERIATQQSTHQKSISELREGLDRTSRSSYSQARNEAQKRAATVAKEVAAKQREQQDMFLTEIGGVRDAASTNSKSLEKVEGDVAGVADKVNETRRDLAETEDMLLSAQDQIAGVNTRVEVHATDIQRLRDRTERMTTPFTLEESKDRTKVDDIQVRLKNADVRKNRYTVEILADDQVIVQKDRYLNEPVEFYVTGADRPYEIVVTSIQRDKVSGYLSKPKFAALARR